jgi:hypothetical protein
LWSIPKQKLVSALISLKVLVYEKAVPRLRPAGSERYLCPEKFLKRFVGPFDGVRYLGHSVDGATGPNRQEEAISLSYWFGYRHS